MPFCLILLILHTLLIINGMPTTLLCLNTKYVGMRSVGLYKVVSTAKAELTEKNNNVLQK